jgi:hypothetical protein
VKRLVDQEGWTFRNCHARDKARQAINGAVAKDRAAALTIGIDSSPAFVTPQASLKRSSNHLQLPFLQKPEDRN